LIDSKRHVGDNVIKNDLCSHSEDDLCSQKCENDEIFDSAVSIDSIEDVSSISQSELSVEADISDDKTLVEAARNGDSLAITLLVIKYHGFLDKYVGLLNIPVRYKEDYIQEGLIGLLKAVRTFDVEKGFSFSTYAWRCIKNSIISEIRRNERCGLKNEVSVDELQDGILEEFSGVFVTSPEDEYIDKESSSQLHDTIFSVLSTYESQVFGMYLAEIPYSQIASRLGKDVKSIDNAIQRIKNKLKKLV
jgi:RNA polymerase sporulation-specific sigma factor